MFSQLCINKSDKRGVRLPERPRVRGTPTPAAAPGAKPARASGFAHIQHGFFSPAHGRGRPLLPAHRRRRHRCGRGDAGGGAGGRPWEHGWDVPAADPQRTRAEIPSRCCQEPTLRVLHFLRRRSRRSSRNGCGAAGRGSGRAGGFAVRVTASCAWCVSRRAS